MLTDDQLIDELRRAFAAETEEIGPRPGLLGRVHRELAATSASPRRASRPRFRADAIFTALTAGVALAVAVVALVVLHHGKNSNPSSATSPVPVGTVSIAAHAPDPSGGLPWGLRTIHTRPLQGCLQIGRVQSGQIGALGRDGAFGNDGRFHPIPLATNFPCGRTDAHGHLFLNVFDVQIPASASLGRMTGCSVDQTQPARLLHGPHARGLPACPARDLRNVAYGVLGPDAVSITYTLGHHSVTERTGLDGAYIVVARATQPACTFTPQGKRCLGGGGEITSSMLQSGLIQAVTYRDGHVCRLSTASSAAAASCPNIGYARYPPFHPPHITAAQVSATVTPSYVIGTRFCYRPNRHVFLPIASPCNHGIPPGYKIGQQGQRTLLIHLRFVARLAADNHHSVYEFSLGRASGPGCSGGPIGGGVAATTMSPISAGQHVVLQEYEAPCPGTFKGLITYQPNGGPGRDTLFWASPIRDHSTLVGRFTFVVR